MSKTIYDYISEGSFPCECGKTHGSSLKELIVESGALKKIPALIEKYGGHKVFLLADVNTHAAAGETVCQLLKEANIPYSSYVFPESHLEPDEYAVGAAVMHFDNSCDIILGVGSGVINDTGKILANLTRKPYMIAATAPSMDGYASATSSMARSGLKISLNSCCPWVIIGDLDILCGAPLVMLQSGLGDMVAKYVSICEWRIANRLLGEDFCPVIAQMVRDAVHKCVTNAQALVCREPEAVAAVMEGLVITGIAMSYAGMSRPASGMEHYISHIWDMRALAVPGSVMDTHGIQCGVGTLMAMRAYEQIRQLTPDKDKALAYAADFDLDSWNAQLTAHLADGANAMIQNEQKEGKYDKVKHAARLTTILEAWADILQIIDEEIPTYEFVENALKTVNAVTAPEQIGFRPEEIRNAFLMSKDIRDKYVGTRLLWDLGELETVADKLFKV